MANSNGWGDGSVNNNIGWGQAPNNNISWGKSQITSWSGATDIDGGNAPENTVAPAVTGTAQEGQTLTCSTGTWSGSPTYTYQWKRNGSNIGSATNSTYVLVTADVGQSIKCTVTATNFIGSANADSNTVTPTSSVDADAQAFITAASITDPTQQAAINTLVVDLKGYNIWSKMQAVYPFVGGTASTHKFNLKDPRDLDVAFRGVFVGGWTHSSNGALPNGTNAYIDTKYATVTNLNVSSHAFGIYSRTNDVTGTQAYGVFEGAGFDNTIQNWISNGSFTDGASANTLGYTANPTTSLIMLTRRSQSDWQAYRAGVSLGTRTTGCSFLTGKNFFFSARNDGSNLFAQFFLKQQLAFAFLSDGLTNTESGNLYTAVQTFQTTLGRSIGTQTVSDADAQAFVTAANIVDQVEANAINNLVIGMKADGLWTKMKAVYPFVGGTAATHKFNLKNPLDTNAAFRILWGGGVTHSSNGVQFGGVNGIGDTNFNPSTNSLLNSTHFSFYSRTITSSNIFEVESGVTSSSNALNLLSLRVSNITYAAINSAATYTTFADSDSRAFYIANRTASNVLNIWRNSVKAATGTTTSNTLPNGNHWLGAFNNIPSPGALYYSTKQCAFASIGDGLTDTEAANFYTAVQAFQTTLGRQV